MINYPEKALTVSTSDMKKVTSEINNMQAKDLEKTYSNKQGCSKANNTYMRSRTLGNL